MKRIILIISIIISSVQLIYSQDQTINGNIFIGLNVTDKFEYGNYLMFQGTDPGDAMWIRKYVHSKNMADLRINIGDDNSGDDRFVIGNIFWNSGGVWKDHFVVTNQSRVGIGVSRPTCALDVNGTIRSKEVKVEATGWADFVFGEDYRLPSLSEVESHIKEKGTLPDIPSEREVKESGVNLGEMQVKLLQKIEELTLYMIELKKENEELRKEINVLKDKK